MITKFKIFEGVRWWKNSQLHWKENGKLEEALTISQYRKNKDLSDTNYTNKMKDIFKKFYPENLSKNGYRAYFPLSIDIENVEIEPPQEIVDWLRWNGFYNFDYRKGLYTKNHMNFKLGRLFQKRGREDLLKIFMTDPKRNIKETDFYVVFSIHPYDILGMSTNRGWSTCHDLEDVRYNKNHLYGLYNFMNGGGFIAYLIKKNDKNIKNPISRVLIEGGRPQFYVDNHIYGVNLKEFREYVEKWTGELNNNIQNISKVKKIKGIN